VQRSAEYAESSPGTSRARVLKQYVLPAAPVYALVVTFRLFTSGEYVVFNAAFHAALRTRAS
jgi:hypothetical protein